MTVECPHICPIPTVALARIVPEVCCWLVASEHQLLELAGWLASRPIWVAKACHKAVAFVELVALAPTVFSHPRLADGRGGDAELFVIEVGVAVGASAAVRVSSARHLLVVVWSVWSFVSLFRLVRLVFVWCVCCFFGPAKVNDGLR